MNDKKQIEIAKAVLRFLVVSKNKCDKENCISYLSIQYRYNKAEILESLKLLVKHDLIEIEEENSHSIIHLLPNGSFVAASGLISYLNSLKTKNSTSNNKSIIQNSFFWIILLLFILLGIGLYLIIN